MGLTKKYIDHVLTLAHLDVNEVEKEQYLSQLDKVLDYMTLLDKLDLTNVDASYENFSYQQKYREDEVKPSNIDITLNAPDYIENAFQVPRILGNED